ncbi:conserved hypothetical protein [Desulfosarcina cetonica]|uniref:S1 family peptidase n=1 Tax=Desulfosarcina cetonica TaxID=90730 RepID=UPI0006D0A3A0|nr:serine protease [Desulfosarcina cetonica]VTR71494.1 conserved hypothetical protein [Desulfosarcina cetonica]
MKGNAHRTPWVCQRMIQCVFILCLAVFLTALTRVPARGDAAGPDPGIRFPAPASEMAQVITDWLERQGLTVHRDSPAIGHFHLSADRPREHWYVTIHPQSALASTVTVVYDGPRPSVAACQELREYVEGYLRNPLSAFLPPPYRQPQHIPTPVLEKFEAVVCIRTRSTQEAVQFSGVVVDPDGLVLCTAHHLKDHQQVMVTFHDGTERPGTITRRDPHRDLALVSCAASNLFFVPISNGRALLGMGERVFSIGCPNNRGGTLSVGIINSPPRRMGDLPLWQVDMPTYPGSSGSPVFDVQGRLVAMVKGRYRGTATIGFLTPMETILLFLKDNIGS